MKELDREKLLADLRSERDALAARGDHAEALILNDRILDLKGGKSALVERVMKHFESALARKRAYRPPSTH